MRSVYARYFAVQMAWSRQQARRRVRSEVGASVGCRWFETTDSLPYYERGRMNLLSKWGENDSCGETYETE